MEQRATATLVPDKWERLHVTKAGRRRSVWKLRTVIASLALSGVFLASEEIRMTQNEILRVSPGITGPWQVSGRNHTSFGGRVEMDAYYVRNWSVWLDLILLARTAKVVLFGRGAY